jgi:hypothetical protein
MTSLLSYLSAPKTAENLVVKQTSLDDLWAAAESIGTVEVDTNWNKQLYEVSIMFLRATGTRIHAKSSSSSIHVALEGALQEAIALGGRPR